MGQEALILIDVRGPWGVGVENLLQLLLDCTHPLVAQGSGKNFPMVGLSKFLGKNTPLATVQWGCCQNIFKGKAPL